MVCTTRIGAASGSGGLAYAKYVVASALEHHPAAAYYAGDIEGRDVPESAIALRRDLSPAFAARLGIDQSRPLTLTEFANLMNIKMTSGEDIEGRKKHTAHQSVASVFGLSTEAGARLPSVEEITHILAGRRADGSAPRAEVRVEPKQPEPVEPVEPVEQQEADTPKPVARLLPEKRIASAVRAFKIAAGLPAGRDATAEEIQRVADGRINIADYRKKITATAEAVGYVDLTLSSDKSVGICYAQAPTDAERQIILAAVEGATDDAMAYAEQVLGVARRGAGGRGPSEPAELAWASIQHFTARPVADVVRLDGQGREYTQPLTLPTDGDVNIHWHNVVFSSVRTKDGHVGALDLSPLEDQKKTIGAIFHAGFATRMRQHGTDVVLGPHGEARINGIPDWFRKFASQRSAQGEDYARRWAKEQGQDWDTLTGEMKATLIDKGVAAKRQAKSPLDRRSADEGGPNIARWQAEAAAAGYKHRSVLRPGRHAPDLTDARRIEKARAVALPLLDAEFQKNAVLPEGKIHEIAARGLIVSGLGKDAAKDVAAIVATFRERGITVNGQKTELTRMVGVGDDGRRKVSYTTGHALELEERVIALVREAAADKSRALTPGQIDAAAERFLATWPHIDREGTQWKAQREMQHAIGEGGRLSLSIGVAGSGKTSSVIGPLVDAWHADGRTVIGMTVPWKASGELRKAGVDQALAIDPFLQRVAKGKITVDSRTVIVADEVSQIGIVHQAALLKLASETGAQLVEIGDPKQCLAVATPGVDLMVRTIGDESVAKLLTTIRQRDAADRAISGMFRDGQAADGIAAMAEKERFHLVAGGADATVQHAVGLWRKLTDANKADPDHTLLVIAPTNAAVQQIGQAIRENRRAAGEIGGTDTVLKARDPNSGATYDLPVASGDRLRLFSRIYDADTPGRQKSLASNGDVVEVREVLADGLRIRNEEGAEGRVTWSQMKPWRAPKNDPIMASYGHVLTADTAQSLTRDDAIEVLSEGSAQMSANKNYVGLTRQTGAVHLVVSESYERAAIVRRQMLGSFTAPSREDVVRNIADNLSKFTVKNGAMDTLRRAFSVERGVVSERRIGAVGPELRGRNPGAIERPSMVEASRMKHVAEKVAEIADQVRRTLHQERQQSEERGPALGM